MIEYEKSLNNQSIKYIAGIDEAGRGPLAGPLVVAAVILDTEKILQRDARNNDVWSQIQDSKTVTPKKRDYIFDFIVSEAISYSIIEINEKIIDEIKIGTANKMGFSRAVENLQIKPQHILTDYFKIDNWPTENQTNITKGDSLSISIAAASILAKVTRDRVMLKIHQNHPLYGFDKHKGYGTKKHIEAIHQYGPCEVHRKSFAPIRNL